MNSEAVNAICKLCKKRIASNHQFIQEHFRPFFFGAMLIPIAKKDGGTIRHITIGTVFHKLISSTIMCNLKEKLHGTFSPVQLGMGMPGSAENIVHGIRNLLSDHPDWVLVSLDHTNAFNYVSRVAFFKQVQDNFLLIHPLVWQCSGQHSHLLIRGAYTIASSCGVR